MTVLNQQSIELKSHCVLNGIGYEVTSLLRMEGKLESNGGGGVRVTYSERTQTFNLGDSTPQTNTVTTTLHEGKQDKGVSKLRQLAKAAGMSTGVLEVLFHVQRMEAMSVAEMSGTILLDAGIKKT